MGKVIWFAAKAIVGGLLSYIAPRGLIAMGVPLDRWIEDIFGRLSVEPVLWAISLILFGALFFADHFVRAWQIRTQAKRLANPNNVIREDIGLWPAIESGMRHQATKALEERNRLDSLPRSFSVRMWDAENDLTLAQAACLWVGLSPVNKGPLPYEAQPILNRLKRAVLDGGLSPASPMQGAMLASQRAEANFSAKPFVLSDDFLVSRQALIAYAEQETDRPDFLFPNEAAIDRPSLPTRSGADFPEIGKAILDRYDGQVETFPFRKAVLQLSDVKATAMRRAGEKGLSKISCHMDIENHTRQQFRKCRVRLVAINGERLDSDNFLRIGGLKGGDSETEFAVRPDHSKKRINFMKRDLDDVVSNPPFLLCLNDRDLPLSDGKEHRLIFALECEYEHPTYATVRFFVPEREKVEIELIAQSLDMPDA